MSEKIENFREILIQATQEANMEKSLDLTLARDITEIIEQLQSAVSNTVSSDFCLNNTEISDTVINETEAALNAEEDSAIAKTLNIKTEESETDLGLDVDDMLDELNIESISAESDSTNSETMTNQESPEEFGVKVMLNQNQDKFDVSIEKTLNNAGAKPAEVSSDKIIEQITKHLDSLKANSKVSIVLNPESLGKINLQILNSKDGLSALFTVATNDIRELLMKGLDGLKESLLSHGVSMDNISVKVAEAEETEYNPDWLEQQDSEDQNDGQRKQHREEKEKGLFEKTIAESLDKENGNV